MGETQSFFDLKGIVRSATSETPVSKERQILPYWTLMAPLVTGVHRRRRPENSKWGITTAALRPPPT